MTARLDIVWLGHASTEVRLGGTRLLTDPVLRDRVGHLRRHRRSSAIEPGPVGAVLISHLHHDHLDLPSLRALPAGTPLIVPRGAARLVAASAPGEVMEMVAGDSVVVDGVTVTAVPAEHHPGRFLSRAKGAPLGYLMERAGRVVYFPGDTDLHPVMSDLPVPDVALLPIWGWGRTLGSAHLDPERAAHAATLLRARTVLPVHWGTFAPLRIRRGAPAWLERPAGGFEIAMARHAPESRLRLVRPGPDVHRIDLVDPGPHRSEGSDHGR
jgi:L-ascorbate metabolism protein UlaG (beta-lactamase superfamily)